LIKGIRDSAEVHDLPFDFLSLKEASDLIPGVGLTNEFLFVYQNDACYLWAED